MELPKHNCHGASQHSNAMTLKLLNEVIAMPEGLIIPDSTVAHDALPRYRGLPVPIEPVEFNNEYVSKFIFYANAALGLQYLIEEDAPASLEAIDAKLKDLESKIKDLEARIQDKRARVKKLQQRTIATKGLPPEHLHDDTYIRRHDCIGSDYISVSIDLVEAQNELSSINKVIHQLNALRAYMKKSLARPDPNESYHDILSVQILVSELSIDRKILEDLFADYFQKTHGADEEPDINGPIGQVRASIGALAAGLRGFINKFT